MATTTTITKLLFRRGNDSDRKNTILASGEPGWVLDTKRLWIGDGVTPGGVPALSARADHLHYVDTLPGTSRRWTTQIDNLLGGAQFLDINIIGLSHTMAGVQVDPDKYLRWFHPASLDIRTNKDLVFTNDADFDGSVDQFQNETAAIYHEGTKEFFIGKRNSSTVNTNTINIGDAIIITPRANGKAKVEFTDGVEYAAFTAISAIFDNGEHTLFEDKSVDLNVAVETRERPDGTTYKEKAPHSAAPTSQGTGLYIAHTNYLSAGCFTIGKEPNEFGWGSMQLRPTVYRTGWESWDLDGYGSTVLPGAGGFLGRDPTFSSKSDWDNITYHDGEEGDSETPNTGGENEPPGSGYVGNNRWRPKSLVFHSVRPDAKSHAEDQWGSSYAGEPHFVFESGLIVYDAGDPITGKYNAYKVNQSVDTRSFPRFTGLKIRTDLHETENRIVDNNTARLGEPIPVDSGGTGMNEFTPGSVIRTTGNWDDPQQINDNALTSIRLEQGAFLVGTNEYGAVAHKFTTSQYVRIDYGDGAEANAETGRRDGVIEINNTFAPDFLDSNTEIRERWFTRFNKWTADDGITIRAVGQVDGKDPGELVTFIGDAFQAATAGVTSTGGTIRTNAIDNATADNKMIKIIHNDLASNLYDLGPNNALVLKYQRQDGVENILVKELFAGQTYVNQGGDDAYLSRYLNGLMPVTSTDDNHDTPAAFDNKGYVLAGVQIDAGGHLIGIRSKDLDDRYPQMFYLGTGWKDFDQAATRIQSPADHAADVSSLVDGDIVSNAIGTTVVHNNNTTQNAYVPKNYMGNKKGNTVVLTDINFNNYGTVHSYDSHDLTNIFYDKKQISSLARQIYTHVDQLSASIDDVQDNTFKRDADSVTIGDNITTSWLQQNKAEWSHNDNSGSRIYQKSLSVDDEQSVEWVFDADENTDIYVPTSKTIEWRHKSTASNNDTTTVMMSLQAQTASEPTVSAGDTLLQIKHDNKTRFAFDRADLQVKDATESTKITINNGGITMGDNASDGVRLHGCAARAEKVWTQRAADEEESFYHVSFVRNNNSATANSSTSQTIKTDAGITYSPFNNKLVVKGDIEIPGNKTTGYDGNFVGKLKGSASHVDVISTEQLIIDPQTGAGTWLTRDAAEQSQDVIDETMFLTFVRNNNTGTTNGEELLFTNRYLSFDGNVNKFYVTGTGGAQIHGDLELGANKLEYPDDLDVKIRFHDTSNSRTPLESGGFGPDYWNEIKWDITGAEFQIRLEKINKDYAILHDGNLEEKLRGLAETYGSLYLPRVTGQGSYVMEDEDYFFKGNLVGDIYSLNWWTGVENDVAAGDRTGKKILENGTDGSDAWFRGNIIRNDAAGSVLLNIATKYLDGTSKNADNLHVAIGSNTKYRFALTPDDTNAGYQAFKSHASVWVNIDDDGLATIDCNINNANRSKGSGKVDTKENNSSNDHFITFVNSNNSDAEEELVYTSTDLKYKYNTTNLGTLTCANFAGLASDSSKSVISGTGNDGVFYLAMAGSTTGSNALKVDTGLKFDAGTDTLYAGKFSGDGTGLTGISLKGIEDAGTPARTDTTYRAAYMRLSSTEAYNLDDAIEFNAAGYAKFRGDVTAFASFSDENLKTDVTTIDDALSIVRNLRGVRFKYNDKARELNPHATTDARVGVIAQEVEKHLPEVIKQIDGEDYKRVEYENLTAVLIEAVKQLSARVEELESQIK